METFPIPRESSGIPCGPTARAHDMQSPSVLTLLLLHHPPRSRSSQKPVHSSRSSRGTVSFTSPAVWDVKPYAARMLARVSSVVHHRGRDKLLHYVPRSGFTAVYCCSGTHLIVRLGQDHPSPFAHTTSAVEARGRGAGHHKLGTRCPEFPVSVAMGERTFCVKIL